MVIIIIYGLQYKVIVVHAWVLLFVIVSCTGLFLCFLHLFSNFIQLVSVYFYMCSTLYLFDFEGKFLLWSDFTPVFIVPGLILYYI